MDSELFPKAPPLISIVLPVLVPDVEFTRCMHAIAAAFEGISPPQVVVVCPEKYVADITAEFPWATICLESRRGIYAAMNDGINASQGRYLYFLGKDDIVLPAMRDAVATLAQESPSVLFCDVYWGDCGVRSGAPHRLRLLRNNICHQGIFYSREVLQRHGPYMRKMRTLADYYLNLKIVWDRKAEKRLFYLPKPVAWYSVAGLSSTQSTDPVFRRLYPAILRRYVGRWASCLLRLYRWVRRKP